MSLHITGGEVLAGTLIRTDLITEGQTIAGFDGAVPERVLCLDATGLYVLPGIVDCHGDAFERHIMPRPGVSFDIDLALRDADRAMLASGITTAFHGVTWSWEPGLRGADNARRLVERIAALQPELGADTRFHLRHETFNLAAEAQIIDWLAGGRVGILAFNDHTGGVLKATSRPDKLAKMVERGGIVAPKGPAGSMILFHGCLVHASGSNLSPWNRVSVYLSLCAISNHIRRFKRPGYIAHRDFTPIRSLPDDCLLKHYDVALPWKDGTPAEELQPSLKAA